jgi:hypothetical protein
MTYDLNVREARKEFMIFRLLHLSMKIYLFSRAFLNEVYYEKKNIDVILAINV